MEKKNEIASPDYEEKYHQCVKKNTELIAINRANEKELDRLPELKKIEERVHIEITARRAAEAEITKLKNAITYKDGKISALAVIDKKVNTATGRIKILEEENRQLINSVKDLSESIAKLV